MNSIDDKFDRIFDELHALREEMRAGFAELRTELRTELGREVGGVRSDLSALQRQVTFIVAAFAVGLLGLMGAFVAAQF